MPNPMGDPPEERLDEEFARRTLQEFEALAAAPSCPKHVFCLYVAGNSNRSLLAISNVRALCERYLAGNYELDVVDVYQQPEAMKAVDIVALPTLIKKRPLPPRKFVGDMSDTERIVTGLKLRS